MQGCTANHTFHNWAQTITCKPQSYCQPTTENDLVTIVKDAAAKNRRVRTVGAGHSWAPLVLTRDVLVNLDKLTNVTTDASTGLAHAQAGIRLKKLIPRLRKDGLGLANIGSITEQSIAGAITTGTHGTGLTFGAISTQIVGMRLITGSGETITISEENDRELLNAARLSLGALGIISEVTIRCVPDYDLEFTGYWCKFDSIVDQMESLARQNVRVKFWWLIPPIGANDNVIMSTENPVGAGSTGPSNGGPLPMDTNSLMNSFLHFITWKGTGLNQFVKYKGNYDQILTIPLIPVLHRECEYAIPMGKAAEALRAFKRIVDEGEIALTLPLEVRFMAKDEMLLSPGYEQDVCYIGIASQPNANEVIERFEPIMKSLGGRPHWGKCFSVTRAEAEAMYPGFQRFRQIRKELDPKGVFSNEFLAYMFD